VLDPILRAALDEDRGSGDVTSLHTVPAGARARARLVAKAPGVLAGLAAFARVFTLCDAHASVVCDAADGQGVVAGQELARIEGDARALLLAERTALNVLQRMSGIATSTARHVAAVRGTAARVLDTRKTTPNLRVLEKYAVVCGGGENHRMGLYDEALVKENHLELAGRGLEAVLLDLRAACGPALRITAEARDAAEAGAAVRGGADVVLLDNMTPGELTTRCAELRGLARERGREVLLEASGGVTLETIGAFARTGVDRISVGALTHSAPALDLALYLEPAQ
jgi:nicotinate-nucleotide pyrophosphorylase (carboxylating)